MKILEISHDDPELWERIAVYAENCSWGAGRNLARDMRMGKFTEWERVFAAMDGERPAGFCTLAKTDCIPDKDITPFIGYVFVGEEYRGRRLSGLLTAEACRTAADLGFPVVYLVSGEIGLYEKYGFEKIGDRMASYGKMAQVFRKPTR